MLYFDCFSETLLRQIWLSGLLCNITSSFKINFIYLFILGCMGSSLLHGLSLVKVSKGSSLVALQWFLLWSMGSRAGSIVVALRLSCSGGMLWSSWIRDWTYVFCSALVGGLFTTEPLRKSGILPLLIVTKMLMPSLP